MPWRSILKRLAFVLIAVLLAATGGTQAWAARKTHHAPAAITPPRDAAPDTTATIRARVPAPPNIDKQDLDKDDGPLPPPFHLPTASRARMRACGQKWQAMKMAGEAGEEIWRSFATRCLAAADASPLEH